MFRRIKAALGLSSPPPRPVPRARPAPERAAAVPSGPPPKLELYKYDACPYCHRVQRHIKKLGLDVEMHDTRRVPEAQEALYALTGRTQVPCLVIDGVPMLESRDIINWLDAHVAERANA